MERAPATQHGGEPNPLDDTGLCLLSLDSGSVCGLSTLYILKKLMSELAYEHYGNTADRYPLVKLCEVFALSPAQAQVGTHHSPYYRIILTLIALLVLC